MVSGVMNVRNGWKTDIRLPASSGVTLIREGQARLKDADHEDDRDTNNYRRDNVK